jgi:hypothetical protein
VNLSGFFCGGVACCALIEVLGEASGIPVIPNARMLAAKAESGLTDW